MQQCRFECLSDVAKYSMTRSVARSLSDCVTAELVVSARRSERITPLLRELHWLRVPEQVTFRLCVLAYTAVFMEQCRRIRGDMIEVYTEVRR